MPILPIVIGATKAIQTIAGVVAATNTVVKCVEERAEKKESKRKKQRNKRLALGGIAVGIVAMCLKSKRGK